MRTKTASWGAAQVAKYAGAEPRLAVCEAYAVIDALLSQVAEVRGLDMRDDALRIAYELERSGAIPEAGYRTIEHLRQVRNLVAHGVHVEESELGSYLDTARIALDQLHRLLRQTAAAA